MGRQVSLLLSRHTGASDHANTRFVSLRGGRSPTWQSDNQQLSRLLRVARSEFRIIVITFIIALFNLAFAETPRGPELGTHATPEQIAKWDIGVFPDGEGLPEGEGTVAEGRKIYEAQCMSCHGPDGLGASADQLAGAQMPLTSEYPEQTIGSYWPYATTLFDMIRRSMPMDKPGSLSDEEVYAVTAYLLYLNDIISEDDMMNAETLPEVQMPNRDGFINVYDEEKGRE